MSILRVVMTMLLLAGLSACVSNSFLQQQQQRQQAYNAAAGAPVQGFRLVPNRIYSWEPLSDKQVVVYTQSTRAYLLDVRACSDLTFTNGIALTSSAQQVQTGLDKVVVDDGCRSCSIEAIRPVDLAQFKLDKEAQHVGIPERMADRPAETVSWCPSPIAL
jgi:hypothetical protein